MGLTSGMPHQSTTSTSSSSNVMYTHAHHERRHTMKDSKPDEHVEVEKSNMIMLVSTPRMRQQSRYACVMLHMLSRAWQM